MRDLVARNSPVFETVGCRIGLDEATPLATGGVTRRVGLGLPQSYEVGLSPMGIGLAAVVDRVDERRFW
jgi:hypothetical protein